MSYKFDLPEAVVVSGASSGLGSSVSETLLNAGVSVFGVDIQPAKPELQRAGYTHFQLNISAEESWSQIANGLEAASVRSYGLVTSAATLDIGDVVSSDLRKVEKVMAVNFMGTLLAFRQLIPGMIRRGGGALVAIASIDATFAEQQLAVYAASKGAVRQLTRTTAMDFARQGIRANVLSPGPMMTELFQAHMNSANDPAKFLAVRAQRQPGGRVLDPSQVADAAVFLLSKQSSALNGSEIIADGGLTTSFDFRTGAEGASV